MQTFSAHVCIDLCVCRYRFVVHGVLKRYHEESPHHLLLGYHGTGIPRNANRDIAIKGWVTKRANGAGVTYSEWGNVKAMGTRGFWCCGRNLPLQFACQRGLSALLLRQSPLCETVGQLPHLHWA